MHVHHEGITLEYRRGKQAARVLGMKLFNKIMRYIGHTCRKI